MFNAFCNWFRGLKQKKVQALHVFDDNVTGTYINLIGFSGRVTSVYLNSDVDVKPY